MTATEIVMQRINSVTGESAKAFDDGGEGYSVMVYGGESPQMLHRDGSTADEFARAQVRLRRKSNRECQTDMQDLYQGISLSHTRLEQGYLVALLPLNPPFFQGREDTGLFLTTMNVEVHRELGE